jgi:Family of unknown function (DUF6114)
MSVTVGNLVDHVVNRRSYTGPVLHGQESRWTRFGMWRKQRPWVGSLLMVLSGIEMFFSGQLDLGNIHVQLGIEGFQATIIPILLVLLGLLAMLMPTHRIFYGIIGLVVAVYSLIGVNLGGFVLGMLLGSIGGILIVAWMPKGKVAGSKPKSQNLEKAPAEARPLAHGRL